MQKQRPFLSVALAFAICLNSTCAISVAAAAPSAPDVENPIFAEDFESYDASLWTVSDGNWSVEEAEGEQALWGSDTGLISTGSMEWTDYSLSYDMTPAEDKKRRVGGSGFPISGRQSFLSFQADGEGRFKICRPPSVEGRKILAVGNPRPLCL